MVHVFLSFKCTISHLVLYMIIQTDPVKITVHTKYRNHEVYLILCKLGLFALLHFCTERHRHPHRRPHGRPCDYFQIFLRKKKKKKL